MRGPRFSGWRAAMVATVLLWGSAGAVGATPASASVGEEERVDRNSINIVGDSQFNPANGVRSGSGTKNDPYVISNWRVGTISIRDTDAYVLIKDNDITSQLRLNWNGDRTTVVNNTIGDLRVNQNIERTGDATGGLIAHNTIGIVGQLRHFDGVFEHNLVKGDQSLLSDPIIFTNQAVQFDGFHGSRFRNNTIYGFVDVKLHGHHHGSGFAEGSHYHGASGEEAESGGHAMHGPGVDHTKRYHEVFISNNKIFSDGDYALRYTDQAHAGDDRTAPSETNPDLNKSHTHYTRVHLVGNKLTGAGLMVDIFNADDERHVGTQTGLVDIRDNVITLERTTGEHLWTYKDGISVRRAVDAMVRISGNSITGEAASERDALDEEFAHDSGIYLDDVNKAHIHIGDNQVNDLEFGVRAAQMTESVYWWIHGLQTNGVAQPVYYDNSVKNQPRRDQ